MSISTVFFIIVLSTRFFTGSQAGLCWAQVSKDGRCVGLMTSNVSRDECCSSGAVGIAWSRQDVTASTLFKWTISERGGPGDCTPCHGESSTDTCDEVECGPGKECKISSRGKPRCVCSPNCSPLSRRGAVCGSDGNTYQNECRMKKASCRRGIDIQVAYNGVCQTSSCDDVVCSEGKNCVVDQNNTPHCVSCMLDCPSPGPFDMVCGANGVTYESLCQLRVATCLLGRSIGVAYNGECKGALSCETLSCVRGKECLISADGGTPRCVDCQLYDCADDIPFETEVCGTDNRTYTSWCEMRLNACHRGIIIETQYFGKCQGGDNEHVSLPNDTQEAKSTELNSGEGVIEEGAVDWPGNSGFSEYEAEDWPFGKVLESEYIETLPDKMVYTSLEELEQLIRNS